MSHLLAAYMLVKALIAERHVLHCQTLSISQVSWSMRQARKLSGFHAGASEKRLEAILSCQVVESGLHFAHLSCMERWILRVPRQA